MDLEWTGDVDYKTLSAGDVDYKTLHECLRELRSKAESTKPDGTKLTRSRNGRFIVMLMEGQWRVQNAEWLTEKGLGYIRQRASEYLKHRQETEMSQDTVGILRTLDGSQPPSASKTEQTWKPLSIWRSMCTWTGLFAQPYRTSDRNVEATQEINFDVETFMRLNQKSGRAVFGATYDSPIVTLDIGFSPFTGLILDSKGEREVARGLFGNTLQAERELQLYNVDGVASVKIANGNSPMPVKFTMRRLSTHGIWECLYRDYKYLQLRKRLQLIHPHIADVLSAFVNPEGPDLMIAFPRALSTLEQLLIGNFDRMEVVSLGRPSLWTQFVGLASALAYYHEACQPMVFPRAPSILVYFGNTPGELTLKFTEFTSSGPGGMSFIASLELLKGDQQEVRRLHMDSVGSLYLQDVHQLCGIFVELSIFIVDGCKRVQLYRNRTVRAVTDQERAEIAFEFPSDNSYAGQLKKEQSDTIKELSGKSREVDRIQYVLFEGCDLKLDAKTLCQHLVEMLGDPNRLYHDGMRVVKLHPGEFDPHVSIFDRARTRMQRWAGYAVDWSPLPPLIRPCVEGEIRVDWKYGEALLSVVLSSDETEQYKLYCLPMFKNSTTTIIPSSKLSESEDVEMAWPSHEQPQASALAGQRDAASLGTIAMGSSRGGTSTTAPDTEEVSALREVHWCADQFFSEPKEIRRRPVKVRQLMSDKDFYVETNQALGQIRRNPGRGWFSGLDWFINQLSWKICVEVEFKEFQVVEDDNDQILLLRNGLPSNGGDYEHGFNGETDTRMKLVAAQAVAGLRHPHLVPCGRRVISRLPKRRLPPKFEDTEGNIGWGMYAKIGLSLKKMLWWLLSCLVVLVLSAAPWLIWVDRYDLQTAFVPGGTVLAIFTACVAMAQVVG